MTHPTPTHASAAKPQIQVPLLDLTVQYNQLRDELLAAVTEVLDSQQCINGPAVAQFEHEMAVYCQTAAAVGVSSGTDALICALMTLGIEAGDEVITAPYTFFATAGAIWRLGAKPVFVDIDPVTFNIDTTQIESAVSERTKAIMPVHLFGQMADMDPIMAIARKYGLAVVEDAAQAIGSVYKGRKAGTIGTAGCLSFFPSKNLGCAGDGGMIVTQDKALAEKFAICRNHGAESRYYHQTVGGNFRLDTVQAAYLSVKLRHIETWHQQRRENAVRYNELLAGVDEVVTPKIAPDNVSIYNQYVIRAKRRDELQKYLQNHGIGCAIYYPLSLHEQDCFSPLGYKKGDFPESERAASETLAIPIYPELSDEQIGYVAESIKRFYGDSA